LNCQNLRSDPKAGFTLAEVLISLALLGMMLGGIITAYLAAAQRAEWASASAAAHRLAVMKMEQLKAAPWDWVYNDGQQHSMTEFRTLDMPRTLARPLVDNEVRLVSQITPRSNDIANPLLVFVELVVTVTTNEVSHVRNFVPPPLKTYRAPD
jgi:prepilin-type N-terminal cleavage/methylation domain-containing protein